MKSQEINQKMKKPYAKPALRVVMINAAEIICTSGEKPPLYPYPLG